MLRKPKHSRGLMVCSIPCRLAQSSEYTLDTCFLSFCFSGVERLYKVLPANRAQATATSLLQHKGPDALLILGQAVVVSLLLGTSTSLHISTLHIGNFFSPSSLSGPKIFHWIHWTSRDNKAAVGLSLPLPQASSSNLNATTSLAIIDRTLIGLDFGEGTVLEIP